MTSFTHTLLLFYNLLFSFNVQIFFILLVSTSSTTSNWSKSTHIRTGISGAISIDPPEQGIQEFSMTIKNATGIYYRTNILRIYPRYHIRNLLPRKIIFRQSFGKYSKRRERASRNESTVDWHFYEFPLLQTCFIVFVTFSSILKHPNKSFLTHINIFDIFYHTSITVFIIILFFV